jgi:lytic cellulose monooxygenase (C1-hydroxylating)
MAIYDMVWPAFEIVPCVSKPSTNPQHSYLSKGHQGIQCWREGGEAMLQPSIPLGIIILISLSLISCHSHVTNFVVNGLSYGGFDPRAASNPKVLASWTTDVKEDGWVGTDSYDRPDIICHVNATNALGHAPVPAGSRISLQWQGWPESHHGPVLTYLAYCGAAKDSCERADKTKLEFFEIDRVGLVDPDDIPSQFATAKGLWGSDMLILNNASWVVQIPPKVAPGYYVLRHEIVALHFSRYPALGAQHYPQCFNLQITGTGTGRPNGTLGMKLYEAGDEGLIFDIYQDPLPSYPVPGPTLWKDAVPMASQVMSIIRQTMAAVPGYPQGVATRQTKTPTTAATTGPKKTMAVKNPAAVSIPRLNQH